MFIYYSDSNINLIRNNYTEFPHPEAFGEIGRISPEGKKGRNKDLDVYPAGCGLHFPQDLIGAGVLRTEDKRIQWLWNQKTEFGFHGVSPL